MNDNAEIKEKSNVDSSEEEDLTFEMLQSGLWKQKRLSPYNFHKNGSKLNFGWTHPVYDFMNIFRRALNELGFSEVKSCSVTESLPNITCLLDRALEEVYSSFCCEYSNIYENFRVKSKHTGGWKQVLKHNNCAELLNELIIRKFIPCRYFTILNVFQNIMGDRLNLQEHHSVEMIVADKGLDVANVLGICSELFSRLNITNVEYKPTVHPFTSPTFAACLYNELLDFWVTVAEGGILRPEVCECLQMPKVMVILRLCFYVERMLLCKKGGSGLMEIIQTLGDQDFNDD